MIKITANTLELNGEKNIIVELENKDINIGECKAIIDQMNILISNITNKTED